MRGCVDLFAPVVEASIGRPPVPKTLPSPARRRGGEVRGVTRGGERREGRGREKVRGGVRGGGGRGRKMVSGGVRGGRGGGGKR